MKEVVLLFPHQLFRDHEILSYGHPVWLIEEDLFFSQYRFHKQKIAFHRASMQVFADLLRDYGMTVEYIDTTDKRADIRQAIHHLAGAGVDVIHVIEPVDDWLEQRIRSSCRDTGIKCQLYPTPMFLNTGEDLRDFFDASKESYFHNDFYIAQRKRLGILIDSDGKPRGGKWSFDAENRKKYPKDKTPPDVSYPEGNTYYEAAVDYVNRHFRDNPGSLTGQPIYPYSHSAAEAWLRQFLQTRFEEFGPYEDAIVRDEGILHHSVLTPMLNTGLLTPDQILDAAIEHATEHDIPINSLEGFVRQIIGWREFIRGMYMTRGRHERTTNFWGFERRIPTSFYDGTTGIPPVDATIRKVLETGYCHHIERLMVLGNFMLLCEFDPDEVYRWFMELFIDAYDWVMVPNVYGMSQFADGGLMATKPYISGSNYIRKMSDYPTGDWQAVWDGLFWRFMHVHRDFFSGNPRLGMLLGTWDRMSDEKQQTHLEQAERFLERI
ncbi:MAG: cryptochrome/photolyase family protein [Saprospiraceae bacterium]|nr:cryptochrome/photolyase family protein [Saprospiraceae bacterium]